MTLKPINFDSERDSRYEELYNYFVACEHQKRAPKVQRIMHILGKADTTVYGRIRRHWNEFICEHPTKPEYMVVNLQKRCPRKYFVLAHKHKQAKYFYLFQTAIEKHDKHREYLRRKRLHLEGISQEELPEEAIQDQIPALLDDEGGRLEEDPESEIAVDDDEQPNILDPEEEEEEEEEPLETTDPADPAPSPDMITLMYHGERVRASAYTASRHASSSASPIVAPQASTAQANTTTSTDPVETTAPPDAKRSHTKRNILLSLLLAAIVIVIVTFVVKYVSH